MSTLELIFLAAGGVGFLLFLIIYLKLDAFISLLVVSILVAIVGGVPAGEITGVIAQGMGSTLGYIAVVVGVGAMFGEMLQISGGAQQIANTMLRKFGQNRAPTALAITGLIVSTPVFLDVALLLLVPIIYSLTRSTGKSILYFAIPLLAGMAVAHAFIPPTPGPVAVAALLGADLGWVILFGVVCGVPPMIVGGIMYGRYISKRIHLGVPEEMAIEAPPPEDRATLPALPGFAMVMILILIPIVLILVNTASNIMLPEESTLRGWLNFIGHPFTALILTTLLAFYYLGTRRGYSKEQIQQIALKSLEPVGMIILVTGAGGVFGQVLIRTGVGEALAEVMSASSLPLILLAFLIALLVRVSQGGATISMITAAGIMAPIFTQIGEATGEPVSQPYLALVTIAIASGATAFSHVNDSGFWLVSRFLGLSTAQTLRSWTVTTVIVGFLGLLCAWGISLFV